jgi:FAD/FMN-containing dehydrogenase
VVAGPAVHPFSAARDVCRFYREFSQSAPDDLFVELGFATLPDGQRVVLIFVVFVGALEAADEILRPVREFGAPIEVAIEPADYCDVQQAYDADFPFGLLNYWKSSNLAELSDEAIDTIIAFMADVPSPRPMVIIDQFGGAVARVPDDATAFGHRDAAYDLIIAAVWSRAAEQEAHIEWARRFWDAMEPLSSGDVYVNYLSEEGEDRVRAAYGHHLARLTDLKRRYDPDNVFRNNQNIKP